MFLFLLAFVPSGFADMCSNAPWSDNERNSIVKIHNDLRSKIALGVYKINGTTKPPATDMLKMVYDCELEAAAQKWADTCPQNHSYNGNGENKLSSWSNSPLDITGQGIRAANLWKKEFQAYGWPTNTLTAELLDSGVGHATQMVWSKTSKIGCGVKQCPSKRDDFNNELIVICQYTPKGNYWYDSIYYEGKTCSECVEGTTCGKCTGLCK